MAYTPSIPPLDEQALRRRIGSNLRLFRAARSLSLKQASTLAAIHWRHWQKIEAAEVNLPLRTLARVARAVNVDVTELLRDPQKRLN